MRRFSPRSVMTGTFICLMTLGLTTIARAENDAGKIYVKNCALCHAADGSGSSASGKALGAKDLASPEVQKQSDGELTEVVTKGKGKMPAFGKKISSDEIKSLVAYIRALSKKK